MIVSAALQRRQHTTAASCFRQVQKHHIASDKQKGKSSYTAQFRRIFAVAGLSLNHQANKVPLPGHRGRHSPRYHRYVLDSLTTATRGLTGEAYTTALLVRLAALRREVLANPQLVRGVGLA